MTNGISSGTDIAVIGMACRLPGASDPGQFWDNLRGAVESVKFFEDSELRTAGVSEHLIANPSYVKAKAVLDGIDLFDAGFFGFSPREASIMDPQHRHFLECSWEALENGGCDPSRFDGAIGVFAGVGMNAYMMFNLLTNPDLIESVGMFLVRHTSNDKDFLATRVSYCLDLTGPSVNVQTACSTSLVAVHLGVQSLLNGETDAVLAGGVTFDIPQETGYLYEDGHILSPDGHCRPFEERSAGTLFGSGVGVVLLKRLEDAIANRDTIHAVIKSTAVNNDGSSKVGYLAPSVEGQAAVYAEALELAEIDPETVGYVEAHGTGTPLGDPIEVAALTEAFQLLTDRRGFCGLGSVKSNIGHLDTAAGVAGFIKTVLALENREIPPTLHFTKPNPQIDFENSPFYVVDSLQKWRTDGHPRRAGVSSLGVGGTNAHVILEEAPKLRHAKSERPYELLLLSARTESALNRQTRNLATYFENLDDDDFGAAANTLAVGRRHFGIRRFAVAASSQTAAEILGSEEDLPRWSPGENPSLPVSFMFAGGGSQYPGMGSELYENAPVYRAAIEECLALVLEGEGMDLRPLLLAPSNDEDVLSRMEQPSIALPALFTAAIRDCQAVDLVGNPAARIDRAQHG